jgi:hypothetical protein
VTVLTDGDPGLRAIQRAAIPKADPVLDCFHIARRWQHLYQLATGAGRHGNRRAVDSTGESSIHTAAKGAAEHALPGRWCGLARRAQRWPGTTPYAQSHTPARPRVSTSAGLSYTVGRIQQTNRGARSTLLQLGLDEDSFRR